MKKSIKVEMDPSMVILTEQPSSDQDSNNNNTKNSEKTIVRRRRRVRHYTTTAPSTIINNDMNDNHHDNTTIVNDQDKNNVVLPLGPPPPPTWTLHSCINLSCRGNTIGDINMFISDPRLLHYKIFDHFELNIKKRVPVDKINSIPNYLFDFLLFEPKSNQIEEKLNQFYSILKLDQMVGVIELNDEKKKQNEDGDAMLLFIPVGTKLGVHINYESGNNHNKSIQWLGAILKSKYTSCSSGVEDGGHDDVGQISKEENGDEEDIVLPPMIPPPPPYSEKPFINVVSPPKSYICRLIRDQLNLVLSDQQVLTIVEIVKTSLLLSIDTTLSTPQQCIDHDDEGGGIKKKKFMIDDESSEHDDDGDMVIDTKQNVVDINLNDRLYTPESATHSVTTPTTPNPSPPSLESLSSTINGVGGDKGGYDEPEHTPPPPRIESPKSKRHSLAADSSSTSSDSSDSCSSPHRIRKDHSTSSSFSSTRKYRRSESSSNHHHHFSHPDSSTSNNHSHHNNNNSPFFDHSYHNRSTTKSQSHSPIHKSSFPSIINSSPPNNHNNNWYRHNGSSNNSTGGDGNEPPLKKRREDVQEYPSRVLRIVGRFSENLPPEEINHDFVKYGRVRLVEISRDYRSAFVEFDRTDDAILARRKLEGSSKYPKIDFYDSHHHHNHYRDSSSSGGSTRYRGHSYRHENNYKRYGRQSIDVEQQQHVAKY
ncbi:hypothetical protein AKO1_003346 [Acrasis kona]|uniref:RRM domain-containing protein n=1 Tax=Acrasis kona TaxID=1008807 RepID=A0AAW2Z8D1_9EUKA